MACVVYVFVDSSYLHGWSYRFTDLPFIVTSPFVSISIDSRIDVALSTAQQSICFSSIFNVGIFTIRPIASVTATVNICLDDRRLIEGLPIVSFRIIFVAS